jgi:hypothetical protein
MNIVEKSAEMSSFEGFSIGTWRKKASLQKKTPSISLYAPSVYVDQLKHLRQRGIRVLLCMCATVERVYSVYITVYLCVYIYQPPIPISFG